MKTLPALVTPRLHDIRTSRREREDVESGRGARPYQHEMNFSEGVGDRVEFCLFIFCMGAIYPWSRLLFLERTTVVGGVLLAVS